MSRDPSLATQAGRINEEHAKCVVAVRGVFRRWIRIGRMLVEAKAALKAKEGPKGRWIPWVEKHCDFGYEQATRYMNGYKNKDEVEEKMLHSE
jgi:hypothetical protein